MEKSLEVAGKLVEWYNKVCEPVDKVVLHHGGKDEGYDLLACKVALSHYASQLCRLEATGYLDNYTPLMIVLRAIEKGSPDGAVSWKASIQNYMKWRRQRENYSGLQGLDLPGAAEMFHGELITQLKLSGSVPDCGTILNKEQRKESLRGAFLSGLQYLFLAGAVCCDRNKCREPSREAIAEYNLYVVGFELSELPL